MSPEEEKVINRNTMKLQEHLYKSLKQRDQYKSERDSLIDDIAVLKANISRLERENRDLKHENKALRLQSNTYFDEWQSVKNLYTTLTNHIPHLTNINIKDNTEEPMKFIKRIAKERD